MSLKILILGSKGFIGKNIADYFKSKYSDVYMLDRSICNFSDNMSLLQNINKINPDILINCSGIVGSSVKNEYLNDYDLLNDNIQLNTNILNCCINTSIKKIIMLSSYRVYGDTIHDNYDEDDIQTGVINHNMGYLIPKKLLDIQSRLFMKKTNIPIICLLLTNIYGQYDDFSENSRIVPSLIYKLKHNEDSKNTIIINGNKNVCVNLVYVNDISLIIDECLYKSDLSGNIIIFNKNGTITIFDLINKLSKIMNIKKQIVFTDTSDKIIQSSIMKPNTSKFQKYFENFYFSDINDSLHYIISNLYDL
jgi:nucleoside-diphosphate-sugar epimerase